MDSSPAKHLHPPSPESMRCLNKIRIQECGEKLVDLHKETCLFDIREGIPPFLRKTVYEKLNIVAKNVPEQYRLLLWRGYRSLKDQKTHWDTYSQKLKQQHPDWPQNILNKTVNRSFAPYNQPTPPGHSTGGAIDIILTSTEGKPLDLTPPLDNWKLGATFHAPVSKQQMYTRTVLCRLLEAEGFSNYPLEYWHYSYGDSAWAVRTRNPFAIYAGVERYE